MADNEELVQVFASEDEVEGHLYRTLLEEADIPVVLRNLTDIWGQRSRVFNTQPQPRISILVRAGDEHAARALVEDFRRQADAGALQVGEHDTPPEDDGDHARRARRGELIALGLVVLLLVIIALVVVVRRVLELQ